MASGGRSGLGGAAGGRSGAIEGGTPPRVTLAPNSSGMDRFEGAEMFRDDTFDARRICWYGIGAEVRFESAMGVRRSGAEEQQPALGAPCESWSNYKFCTSFESCKSFTIHGEVISWFFGEFRASWKKVGSYNLACLNGQSTFKTDTSTT